MKTTESPTKSPRSIDTDVLLERVECLLVLEELGLAGQLLDLIATRRMLLKTTFTDEQNARLATARARRDSPPDLDVALTPVVEAPEGTDPVARAALVDVQLAKAGWNRGQTAALLRAKSWLLAGAGQLEEMLHTAEDALRIGLDLGAHGFCVQLSRTAAQATLELNRYQEAADLYRLALTEAAAGEPIVIVEPPRQPHGDLLGLIDSLHLLGRARGRAGDPAGAEEVMREALQLASTPPASEHPAVSAARAEVQHGLAVLISGTDPDRLDEAVEFAGTSADTFSGINARVDAGRSLAVAARLLTSAERPADAVAYLEKATAVLAAEPEHLVGCLDILAATYARLGRGEDAKAAEELSAQIRADKSAGAAAPGITDETPAAGIRAPGARARAAEAAG
jgi:tetratricopeptide (TPR) repeat protein